MLRLRFTFTALAFALALVVADATVTAAQPASAQPLANCPSSSPPFIDVTANCNFGVTAPQIDSGPFHMELPAGAGGSSGCIRANGVANDSSPAALDAYGPREISCTHPTYGQYSAGWDCYLLPVGSSPAEGMLGYPEHAEDGTVYWAACFPPGNANPHDLSHWSTCNCGAQGAEAQWNGAPATVVIPPGEDLDFDEGGPGLLEVWIEALNSLEMPGPVVTTAPPVGTAGLVNLPVWMWTEQADQTWPELLETRAAGGEWVVEAWAEPQHIEWDMGDGRPPEQCGPGVAWDTGGDIFNPPEGVCRHTYLRPSSTEPGGVFQILALTTWRVWWHVNGEFDNEAEIQVGTTAAYQVNEVQVLTGQ